MELLGFLNFLLFALAPVFFIGLFFRVHPARVFLPALLVNATLLYLFACFHVHEIGILLIFTANLALLIPCGIKCQKEGWRNSFQRFNRPGVFLLLILLIGSFLTTLDLRLNSWDSISHWSKVVYLFLTEGLLPCEYPHELVAHAGYPPGMAMISVLVHNCFPPVKFSESLYLFSANLINVGALVWLIAPFQWSDRKQLKWAFPLIFLILPLLRYLDCNLLGYADSSLLFLASIAFYFQVSRKHFSIPDLLCLGIMTAFIFMVRSAGWGYVIGFLILFAVQVLLKRKTILLDSETGRLNLWRVPALLFVFFWPLFMKWSWNYQLELYHTVSKFSGSRTTLAAFQSTFGWGGKGWWELLCFLGVLARGFLEYLVLLLLGARWLVRHTGDPARKEGVRMTAVFFAITTILNFSVLFFLYQFEFYDETGFPSILRYGCGFLAIPTFVLLFFTADWLAQERKIEQPALPQRTFIRNMFFVCLAGLIVQELLLRVPNFSYRMYREWRKECRSSEKYDGILRRPGVLFCAFSTTGSGFKNRNYSFLYTHNYLEFDLWCPVLEKKDPLKYRYASITTPKEVREQLLQCGIDYVFIEDTFPEFSQDFKDLFQPGTDMRHDSLKGVLFQVLPDGRLKKVIPPKKNG